MQPRPLCRMRSCTAPPPGPCCPRLCWFCVGLQREPSDTYDIGSCLDKPRPWAEGTQQQQRTSVGCVCFPPDYRPTGHFYLLHTADDAPVLQEARILTCKSHAAAYHPISNTRGTSPALQQLALHTHGRSCWKTEA